MGFEIGTTIGDYQVVDVLGAGGMGQVYKVRNIISDRIEAMKVLLPNLDTDPELAERFMREIKVQASLDHPNIASLHTAQRISNQLLMIMEFVEGCTVESLMRRGRLPLRDAVDYVSQTLSALAYAHARGIVHRDIKPANMMVTPKGVLKLMDFGIAKMTQDHRLTQTGKTVGSLFYMSPEQIRGEANLDPRSDLYSLGITLYEMATGRRPFEGESDYSIMAAHLQQAPQPPIHIDPSLPSSLSDIILMALGKDPSQRFQTADAFKAALGAVTHDIGAGAGAAAPAGYGGFVPAPPTPSHATQTLPNREARPLRPQTQSEMPTMVPGAQMPSQPFVQSPYQQQAPPFQPQPMAYQQQQPPPRSNRAMYMIIGSLATVGVLIAGVIYGPKLWKTEGKAPTQQVAQMTTPVQTTPVQTTPSQTTPNQTTPSQTTPNQTTPSQTTPSQTTPSQTTPPPPVTQTPVQKPPVRQTTTPVHRDTYQTPPPPHSKITPPPNGMSGDPQQPPPNAMPQPRHEQQPPPNAELEELNHDRMLMLPRIDAVSFSMKKLQQEQSRDGLGISGDLVATHRRMGFYMETADMALRRGNTAEARTALANAERELGKLETRFGR